MDENITKRVVGRETLYYVRMGNVTVCFRYDNPGLLWYGTAKEVPPDIDTDMDLCEREAERILREHLRIKPESP